jgi:predicted RNA-binding protein with PIN domain
LIGSDTGLTGNLEHKRNWLIQELAGYQRAKNHAITVVFDGWRSGSITEVEEKRDEVDIIYSRLGEKADSVIVRLARKRGSGCIVVTSDREVRNAVERFGAVALYAGQFSTMLHNQSRSFDDPQAERHNRRRPKKGNPRRLSKKDRKRREKLQKLQS